MSATIWHDVECGSYDVDLVLWEQLASQAEGPILDIGCGTGRVALHLARRGYSVIGLDVEPQLVAGLTKRSEGLPVRPVLGDARGFELDTDIALALAPMQLVQLLPGHADRLDFLGSVAAHLLPGGQVALAIVEQLPPGSSGFPPLPDVREIGDWIYSSLPLDTALQGEEIAIRRLRQTVSPTGVLAEEENEVRIRTLSAAQLEREGTEVELVPRVRQHIPPTDLHVGSTVVVFGRKK